MIYIKESRIENYLVRRVKQCGGKAIKFTSSSYRSIPDRMCVFPMGVIVFVECKRPKGKPTDKQWKEIKWLRSMGQTVLVIDSRPKVDALIKWYLKKRQERLNAI